MRLTTLRTAGPEVVACGDVFGVVFDGEDEAVVFAPNSGDVLISEVGQWRRLAGGFSSLASLGMSGDANETGEAGQAGQAGEQPLSRDNDLRAALRQLGLKID